MENVQDTPKIYSAIIGVMKDIGAVGKDKKNPQQGFMYRGIDQIYNALQPAMIKNKVFVVPTVVSEKREERQTQRGGVLFYSRLEIKYTFFTDDGSSVSAKVVGEAMDSADKATNKAMSAAYKYACFQVFCIPTEEMKDPDAEVHEVAAQQEVIYVDDVKIKALKMRMEKKGVKDSQIFERYKVDSFEKLTITDFMRACKSLEKMADVEEQQIDLGL